MTIFNSSIGANSIDRSTRIVDTSTRNTYTKDICIDSTYTVGIWIRYFGIRSNYTRDIYANSFYVRDVELRILAGSGVIQYIKDIKPI